MRRWFGFAAAAHRQMDFSIELPGENGNKGFRPQPVHTRAKQKKKKRVRIMGGTEKDSLLRVFIMMYLKHNSKSFVSIKERVGLV